MKTYLIIFELYGKEQVDRFEGSSMKAALESFEVEMISLGYGTLFFEAIQCTLIK